MCIQLRFGLRIFQMITRKRRSYAYMRKRIISFVLVLAILLVSVPIVNSVSSDAAVLFIPRLEAPNDATNKYYRTKSAGGWNPAIEGNKDYSDHVAGSVLRNCVGYANGRFNEEAGYGKCKYTYAGNAENSAETIQR